MSDDLFILTVDDTRQSAVDRSDPTRLVFDYVRRIGDVVDRLPAGPLRVLHVGGGALTLPRYVRATRPGSTQIVLEPSVEVIEQVRAEAPLPPRSGIEVLLGDGRTGIVAVPDGSQDLVIVDAFVKGFVPDELTATAFIHDVRRVLAPGGVFVTNMVDGLPFRRVRSFVAAARALGRPGIGTPGIGTPGIGRPGIGRPGIGRPGIGRPDIGRLVIGAEPATIEGRRLGNLIVACGVVPSAPFGSPSPLEYLVFEGRALSDSFGGGQPKA